MVKNSRKQLHLIKKYINIQYKGNRMSILLRQIYSILHILVQLPINLLFLVKLKVYKFKHKISRPIIHYYAVCWNEEKILPFMLDYYGQFVDVFYIYDNYSTDNSNKVLSKQSNVEVIQFQTGNTFNDIIHTDIKNNCWKQSRGKADFVIVCDVDEFLYHPQINDFLKRSIKERMSFFIPTGYNMYSNYFPEYQSEKLIVDSIKNGVFDKDFCKSILFDPHRIVEINYTAGAHFCYPWGIVRTKEDNALFLLHYKNLGVEYVLNRCNMYRNRLSQVNIEKNYGAQYLQEDEKIAKEIEFKIQNSKRII
jgi:hypothetical protein